MSDHLPSAEEPPLGLEHDLHPDIRLGCAELLELHFHDRSRSSAHE